MHAHPIIFAVLLAAIATAASGSPAETRDVRLEVTESGRYILAGRPLPLSDLQARLRELKSSGLQINLHITGSEKVPYKYLMPAVQIAQEEGLGKVGFITGPAAASDASASPTAK
jgi:biopolymer transport protein ExbD